MYEMYVGHPLVKLLFSGHLPPDVLGAKLRAHAERVARRIEALEAIDPKGTAAAGLGPPLLELELRYLRDQLDWLRRGQVGGIKVSKPARGRSPSADR